MRERLFLGPASRSLPGGFAWLLACAVGLAQQPIVSVQTGNPATTEGSASAATFVISRTGNSSQPVRVEYTLDGPATNGVDYVRLPGFATIPSGQNSTVISVATLNDTREEPAEQATLTLVPSTRPFRLVALPDTQYYVAIPRWNDLLTSQMRWIARNKDAQNIAMVLHEGDCTDNNIESEWVFFQQNISLLDGVVPYAVAVGNHDGLGTGDSFTQLFNSYFPFQRYSALPHFGGVFESNKLDNTYYFFSAGGVDWMVLSYEFGPRDAVLAWANQVVSNHPNHRVICVTHAHVYSDDTLHGTVESQIARPTTYGRENDGTDVWEKFLRHHANMAFVFNGHVINDGAGRVIGIGDHGNKVYQMLANYQFLANGGNGFLRLIEFDPARDACSIKTYSPFLNLFDTGPEQQFEFNDLGIFNTNAAYQIHANLASATVTITDDDLDVTPPVVIRVSAEGVPPEITVLFSEPVGLFEAEDPGNYQVDHGVIVAGAELSADGRTVTLSTSSLMSTGLTYTLTVSNVKDTGLLQNPITPNTQAAFTYRRLLLAQEFEEATLPGWTVVDDGTRSAPSQWNLRQGRLEQSSDIFGPTIYDLDHREGTHIFWNNPTALTWEDYTVSATFDTQDDDGVGLLFHYRNRFNYYKLEVDQQRSFQKLLKVVNGVETTLASEPGGYALFAETELRVELSGNQITARINGAAMFGGAITDNSHPRGTIALYSWSSEGVAFDHVIVAPGLNAIPPPPVSTNGTVILPPDLVTIIPTDGEWTLWEFDDPPDPRWKEVSFDDSFWPGPYFSIFANEPDPIPDPRNTSLDLGYTSYYFRHRFNYTGSTLGVCLRLRTLLDDGMVVHLNGAEILRLGMPAGVITHTTLADRVVDNAAYEGPFDLPVANLQAGENVLAVELHQASGFLDSDVVFGVEVQAIIPRLSPTAFSSIRQITPTHVRLTLPGRAGRAYKLESSTNLAAWQHLGTFTNHFGAPLVFNEPITNSPSRFFRTFLVPLNCSEQ